MRYSCDIFVEIDIIRAVENQIPFFISGNKVILTPGIDAVLPSEYFLLVKTSKNIILHAQKYDFIVYVNFRSGIAPEIENIKVIDLKNHYIIMEFNYFNSYEVNEISKLDNLIEYLVEQKLFKEKIIISINQKSIENYNCIISNNLKNLRYKSFFMIYSSLEKEFDKLEILSFM